MSAFRRWLDRRSRWTRAAILVVAVAGLGGGVYRISQYVAAERHFTAAKSAVEAEDLTAARDHLVACAAIRTDSGEVTFELARVCRRLGDTSAAHRHLKRAEELGWHPNAIAIEQTLLRGQTGDFRQVEGTILEWQRVASSPGDRKLFLEVLIPNYLQRHDLQLALSLLRPWTEEEPTNVRAQMWLADAAERLQMYEVAIRAAETAGEAAPDRADVRLKCGQLLMEVRSPRTARPHFEAALARIPGDKEATLGLAKCLGDLGDAPAAIKLIEPILLQVQNDADLFGLRGASALQTGRPAEALPFLERAVKLAPFEAELLHNTAIALERIGGAEDAKRFRERHAAASKDFDDLCQVAREVGADPRNADLRYRAGVILCRNGHRDIGVQWFQSALAEDPNHEPAKKALNEARHPPR